MHRGEIGGLDWLKDGSNGDMAMDIAENEERRGSGGWPVRKRDAKEREGGWRGNEMRWRRWVR